MVEHLTLWSIKEFAKEMELDFKKGDLHWMWNLILFQV